MELQKTWGVEVTPGRLERFCICTSVLKAGTLCGIQHWNMEDLPFDVLKLVLAYGSLDVITK